MDQTPKPRPKYAGSYKKSAQWSLKPRTLERVQLVTIDEDLLA